jgi:hypothetical protein
MLVKWVNELMSVCFADACVVETRQKWWVDENGDEM